MPSESTSPRTARCECARLCNTTGEKGVIFWGAGRGRIEYENVRNKPKVKMEEIVNAR